MLERVQSFWPGVIRDIVYNRVLSSSLVPSALRWWLLRGCGLKIGRCRISPKVWIGSRNITIGAGTFINYFCMFNTTGGISIGQNCSIGMRVTFVTSSHEIGESTARAGAATAEKIVVGDGVWIGACATLLPGTVIGDGAVIAAGAVVKGEVPSNELVGGVPAVRIRYLS